MLSCRCGCASCGYLLCTCSLLFLGLGELCWCNQQGPGNCRALLKSLKMCLCHPFCWQKHEGEAVTSLGEVMAFSGRQCGFPSARLFAKRMLGCERVTQRGQNEMGKQEAELDGGESCPSCRPPGACFPPAILSPQPPPVPWLRKLAQVQPTFAACRAKMSQSLRLLKMTEAQLTHMYLVRGIGERQKNIVRVSDVPNLFLLAAKSNFVRYRRAIGIF